MPNIKLWNYRAYIAELRGRSFMKVSFALFLKSAVGLLIGVILPKLLSTENFGIYTYVLTIVGIALPFSGGGLNHSILYYGSRSDTAKSILYINYRRKGSLINVLLYILIFVVAYPLVHNFENGLLILSILSLSIFSFFTYNLSNNLYRIREENDKYSKMLILFSVLQAMLLPLIAYGNNLIYLSLGYVIIPILVVIFYNPRIHRKVPSLYGKIDKSHIGYGLSVGIGAVISQLLLRTDILLIGIFIGSTDEIAMYRVATILPMGLMILPRAILTTDFVHIAKNGESRSFVLKYYKNYLMIAIPVVCILYLILRVYASEIITFIWGSTYAGSIYYLEILALGLIPIFLLRNPLGFIINAIGNARFNVILSFVMVVFNAFISWIAIARYGVVGVAYSTVISYIVGGIISLIFLLRYKFHLENTSE